MRPEFIDTNVLLYAYDITAGPRHAAARELVGRLGRERAGVLSIQVLQEFYVTAVRKIATPISSAVARDRLRVLSRWPVHSPLAVDVVAAVEISDGSQISFSDAMVIRSAAAMDCPVLWSEDLNVGQAIAGVEVRNPFGP